jgi:dimethylhistidine N-methyltransferase
MSMSIAIEQSHLGHLAPRQEQFLSDVLRGLRRSPKQLPCKYFYDARGSELFDRICELPEYYLTRTELRIMKGQVAQMCAAIGEGARLVEFGSGSSLKTRLLLEHIEAPAAYVPVDISPAPLLAAAGALRSEFPHVPVIPVCADYTKELSLPRCDARRTVIFFPGSTIGNFEPAAAGDFLRRIRLMGGEDGGLLIGFDLKKDPALLHAAYNDSQSITAQFNLNLLARINSELGADFDLDRFAHYAFYNPRRGGIEMHLLSRRPQTVRIGGEEIEFDEGESIVTEYSYKYTLAEFEQLAAESGYRARQVWMDEKRMFAVHWFESLR